MLAENTMFWKRRARPHMRTRPFFLNFSKKPPLIKEEAENGVKRLKFPFRLNIRL